MNEVAVLFIKPGAVSLEDKTSLREAGIVVVEIADPGDARFIRAEGFLGAQELPHGDLLAAAAKAITASQSSSAKVAFAEAVAAAIVARHGSSKEPDHA